MTSSTPVLARAVGARALDLGCSVGRSSFELSRYCATFSGIDLSESFIQAAGLLQEKGALPFEVLTEGDICDAVDARVPEGLDRGARALPGGRRDELPADLGSFDLVLAANLICRLPEPRLFFGACRSLSIPAASCC